MKAFISGYRSKTSQLSNRCIQSKLNSLHFPEGILGYCHHRTRRWNHDHVQATKSWFEHVVIGEKLCPFAPPLLNSNALRIVASTAQDENEAVAVIKSELNLLIPSSSEGQADPANHNVAGESEVILPVHETTLVVFDSPFVDDFRDFVRLSWSLQSEAVVSSGYLNVVQLVLFHPRATHQTYAEESSAADYTIRSPYPTIHLLREVDVLRAVSGGYPNVEEIPPRNKKRLLDQGITVCQDRLQRCYLPSRS